MRRFSCMLFICALLFGSALPVRAEETLFDFTLPQGFFIPEETITEDSCLVVCRDVGPVGGFILTNLDEGFLLQPDAAYFRRFVPEGYDFEYMLSWGRNVSADFILVNLTTMEMRDYKHTFFQKEDRIYDFWLDTGCLHGSDEVDFLIAAGIDPQAEFVCLEEPVHDFGIALPEGCTMTEPVAEVCSIVRDGKPIGGLMLTALSPKCLMNEEEDTFWDQMPEDFGISFRGNDYHRFALERHLARSLPETGWSEYIMMYWNQETPHPFVTANYAITDEATGERNLYHHTIFCRDSLVYDLWLNEDEDEALFRRTAGIGKE